MCKGDFNERLKLLYKMHLSANDESNTANSSPQKMFDVVENASEVLEEADDDSATEDDISKEDTLMVVPGDMGVEGTLENEGKIIMTPTSDILEASLWPASLREKVDRKEEEEVQAVMPSETTSSSGSQSLEGEDRKASVTESESASELPKCSSPIPDSRPLSPNTTKYILSKSPKSAKKLVKDFVASVMKDKNEKEELPPLNQVWRFSLL